MAWAWERPPRIIGHRGSPREATENTIASFLAAARHVTSVELDARLSADGEVVVHHDADLGRVIPGKGRIEEMDAAALAELGIPRLADVLRLGLLVDVELKSDAENAADLPARVLRELRRASAVERALVTSFDWELAHAYARLSGMPAGAISPFAPERDELESFPRLRVVAIAEDAALPEVYATLGAWTVLVWTVDDPDEAKRHLHRGAAAVITDRPGPLSRSLTEDAPAG